MLFPNSKNNKNETKKLFLAPMDGYTDHFMREFLMQDSTNDDSWDYYLSEFLRLPASGLFSKEKIIDHYGSGLFHHAEWKEKNILQILTSASGLNAPMVDRIRELDFKWLDLNLGCPSKTVTSHKGGSYLLSSTCQNDLYHIVSIIREHFPRPLFFSVKMRLGYEDFDEKQFLSTLEKLQIIGVDMVTIHARTAAQAYRGMADWSKIKLAKEHFPELIIIGNGDLLTPLDIDQALAETGVDGVMIGRGAIRAPWLARSYKQKEDLVSFCQNKVHHLQKFLLDYIAFLQSKQVHSTTIINKIKAHARYALAEEDQTIKRAFLQSSDLTGLITMIDKFSRF